MKARILGLFATALIVGPITASAAVVYHFEFTNLNTNVAGSRADFSITLTFDDYLTTTGMSLLDGAPYATTLGYEVRYAGTNRFGVWGFDDDGQSALDDDSFTFNGDALAFQPQTTATNYFTRPGVYGGFIAANAPGGSLRGSAVLTIREIDVPEPATLVLLGLGLAGVGVGAARRRRTN